MSAHNREKAEQPIDMPAMPFIHKPFRLCAAGCRRSSSARFALVYHRRAGAGDDWRAMLDFQGLAPGFTGLGQLIAIVPARLAPGDQPVFVTINGRASNAGVITVK